MATLQGGVDFVKIILVIRSARSSFNTQEQPTTSQNYNFASPAPPSNLDPNPEALIIEETFDNSSIVLVEAYDNQTSPPMVTTEEMP